MKRNVHKILGGTLPISTLKFLVTLALLVFGVFGSVCAHAQATQRQVYILITDGTLQDKSFGPSVSGSSQTLLAPATAYSYSITGNCYGNGDITEIIGSGTQTIASALDHLDSSYSNYLQGSIANPNAGGALPCTLLDRIAAGGFDNFLFSGTATDENIVNIDATGRCFFSATNVVFEIPIGTPDSSQILITSATITATSVLDPTFTTGGATSVTGTSAMLSGTVNPNGAYTSVWFQYGQDNSYGFTSGTVSLPVLLSGTGISQQIAGLSPGLTYHYTITGSNVLGTFAGTDGTFGTPALTGTTPTLVTGSAGSLTVGRATLFGSVNANGLDTTATFNYGTTGTFGLTMAASPSPVSGSAATIVTGSLTGLTAGQTYYYQLVGSNEAGSGTGSTLMFTTPATSSAPTVVTGSADPVGSTTATLNATVNPNAAETNVTFSYGLTGTYGTTVNADTLRIGGTTAVAETAELTGLAPGQLYHFTVTGSNNDGVVTGSDATFTTAASGSAPTVVTGSASGIGPIGATLNGTVNANGLSSVVTFSYGLTSTYGSSITAAESPVSGTSPTGVTAALGGLTPGMTYHFLVTGSNSDGVVSGSDATFMTTAASGGAPLVVTGSASGIGATGATVNGSVNANGLSAVVTFNYGLTSTYGSSIAATQSPVSGTAATAVSAGLASLSPGMTYHFQVTGSNADGLVTGSDATFTTAASGSAPTVVTGSASGIGPIAATLNGTVNANGLSAVVTFNYGLTSTYGSSIAASQSPVSGTSATAVSGLLSFLSPGTTYHFQVTGSNADGLVSGSDATFTTAAATAPTAVTGSASSIGAIGATLNGTVNPNGGVTIVTFSYGLTGTYGTTVFPTLSVIDGTSPIALTAPISGLSPGTIYHFAITGSNSGGVTTGSDAVFMTNSAVAPSVTTEAATSTGSSSATLNASVNPNGVATTAFFEYGLDTSYASGTTSATAEGSGTAAVAVAAPVSGLRQGTTYHYRALAASTSGTSHGLDMTFSTQVVLPAFAGSYQAAITGTGATTCGVATVTVTKAGGFTTKLDLAGKTLSVKGKLSASGTGSVTKAGLTLDLEASNQAAGLVVSGSVSGTLQLSFVAVKEVTSAKVFKYTVRLPHPTDTVVQQGNGYGSMSLGKTGKISVTGKLGDGTTYTAGATLLVNDTWVFYAPLYSKLGCVVGTITMESSTNGDMDGNVLWIKPTTEGTYNPIRFEAQTELYGSIYTAPAKGLPAITSTSGDIEVAGGNLPSTVSLSGTLGGSNKFVFPTPLQAPINELTMSIAPKTGLFSGTIKITIAQVPLTIKFGGAVFQGNLQLGTGEFEGITEPGTIDFFEQQNVQAVLPGN